MHINKLYSTVFLLFLTNFIKMYFNLLQNWKYMHNPDSDSREGKLTEVLQNPRDWIKID